MSRAALSAFKARSAPRGRGFSLIELMVAVAIVAIIAAIALPNYRKYVLRGNRTDAIRTLSYYQQALERCYSQNFSYMGCPQAPGVPIASTQGYYTITFPTLSAVQYTLVAAAIGPQALDTQCTTMQVGQNGAQTAADNVGNDTTLACWGGR